MQPAFTFEGQAISASGGFVSLLRTFAAYWITMFAAGAFIFCCTLGVQGIAALVLSRRLYLRAPPCCNWRRLARWYAAFAWSQPPQRQNLAAAQGNGLAAWQFHFGSLVCFNN